jgi:CDP-paratose 2-epimerase
VPRASARAPVPDPCRAERRADVPWALGVLPERRIAVTGGAGFVGSNLAVALASRHPDWEVLALDNLKRRGAELAVSRLRGAGARFAHADVRNFEDLAALPAVDVVVECSADPSVVTSTRSPSYSVKTNLLGAWHCLELARRDSADLIFLSTSRVYPVHSLRDLVIEEAPTRFELAKDQTLPGASAAGISEGFPMDGERTIYGATKLAAELLIEEYRTAFGIEAVVNRCGVIAGPWQMGRVDQGVFTWWLLAHHLDRPLKYFGYGGSGRQVRDLIHIEDLVRLLEDQLTRPQHWDGAVVNVGGGRECSLSLLETTALCRDITGRYVSVEPTAEERPGDVPVYLSDCARVYSMTDWRPTWSARGILEDISAWIAEHRETISAVL